RGGHAGEGESCHLAAIRGFVRLYLGRASRIRGEKRSGIFPETKRGNQIQARGCAARQGCNREYAKARYADRDRLRRPLETGLANLASQRVEDAAFHPVVNAVSEKIVRILLAAGGANQIQARGCAARRIIYEKNS